MVLRRHIISMVEPKPLSLLDAALHSVHNQLPIHLPAHKGKTRVPLLIRIDPLGFSTHVVEKNPFVPEEGISLDSIDLDGQRGHQLAETLFLKRGFRFEGEGHKTELGAVLRILMRAMKSREEGI